MSNVLEGTQALSTTVDLFKLLLELLKSQAAVASITANRIGQMIDFNEYDEQTKVLKDFISHAEKGGKTETVEVLSKDQAAVMINLLKTEGIPFISNNTENGMLFMYKDVDRGRFMAVAQEAEHYAKDKGHEMNYYEFKEKVGRNQEFFKVDGLSIDEVAVFRRQADKQTEPFIFAINENPNGTFEIYADNKKSLEKTVTDTLFAMGTQQGQDYAKNLSASDKERDKFLETAKELSRGRSSAFIIDAQNPTKIIELNGDQYKIHGLGIAKDENGKEQIVDSVSKYSKAISHDIYSDMNILQMKEPILLSGPESSRFIKGMSRNGEIELDVRYSGSKEKLVGLANVLQTEYVGKSMKAPINEPKMDNVVSLASDFKEKANNMTVYQNIPLPVLLKVERANIEGVYTYNKGNVREIACTPEASSQLNAILKENLAKDKGPLDTWLTMEKYKGHGERSENKDEVYYIVDAALPDAILEISPQDVTYKDAEMTMAIKPPNGMSMDVAILAQVQKMSAPIILTKEEFEMMDESALARQQMLESHHTNPQLTNVVQAEQQKLDAERETLDEMIQNPKGQKQMQKDMTPAQQYVIKQRGKRDLDVKQQERINSKEYKPKEQNKERTQTKTKEKDVEPDR